MTIIILKNGEAQELTMSIEEFEKTFAEFLIEKKQEKEDEENGRDD